MRMPRNFYKSKHDPKKGPARIYSTINQYFTSMSWHAMWKRFEGTNPMFFFIIRRPSGIVEKVVIKEAVPGVTFEMVELPPKPPYQTDPLFKRPAPDEDEKIEAEIAKIQNKDLADLQQVAEAIQEAVKVTSGTSALEPIQLDESLPELPPIEEPEPEPILGTTPEQAGEVDIKPHDRVIVQINDEDVVCEILEIYEDEGQLLVKPTHGPRVIIKPDQISGLA